MSSDRKIPLKFRAEYFFIKATLSIFKYLPENFVYGFTNFIALLFFILEKRHRVITIKNLKIAFPNLKDDEIVELAKKSYKSLSKSVAEIILMYNDRFDLSSNIVNEKVIFDKIKKIQKDSKKGIIFATAHFSNWEYLAQLFAKNDLSILIIGRKGTNFLIEENITKPFREKNGNILAYKDLAILKIAKRVKKGGSIGVLMDQKAGANGIESIFFGKKVDAISSIANLKLKFGSYIIPIFIAREKSGKYKIELYDPIEPDSMIENEEDKIADIVQKYNNALEDVIKKYPEQWFWMHNRWRL